MNADPKPEDRIWYRDARTGDRGYLVTRDGKRHIKLDRPAHDIAMPFREGEWIPERENRPLTRAAIAKVAFVADRELCRGLVLHQRSRREWDSMPEEERIQWMAGHQAPPVELRRDAERHKLYVLIMKNLERLATD